MPKSNLEKSDRAYDVLLSALESGRGLRADEVQSVANELLPRVDAPDDFHKRAINALSSSADLELALRDFANTLKRRLTSKTDRVELHLVVPTLVYWSLGLELGHYRAHVGDGPLPPHSHFGAQRPFTVELGVSAVSISSEDQPGPLLPHSLHVAVLNIGPNPVGNWLANAITPGADLKTLPNAHAGVDASSALAALFKVLAGRLLR